MVKDKRLKRFMERLYCDVCEDELVLKEEVYSNKKINYVYLCENCLAGRSSHIKYPRVVEKEIED